MYATGAAAGAASASATATVSDVLAVAVALAVAVVLAVVLTVAAVSFRVRIIVLRLAGSLPPPRVRLSRGDDLARVCWASAAVNRAIK